MWEAGTVCLTDPHTSLSLRLFAFLGGTNKSSSLYCLKGLPGVDKRTLMWKKQRWLTWEEKLSDGREQETAGWALQGENQPNTNRMTESVWTHQLQSNKVWNVATLLSQDKPRNQRERRQAPETHQTRSAPGRSRGAGRSRDAGCPLPDVDPFLRLCVTPSPAFCIKKKSHPSNAHTRSPSRRTNK